jgi:hypothetical protein
MRNVALSLLIIVSFTFGQTVSITGKVTNSGQAGIQGAIVKLFAKTVACTTAADGSYKLSIQTATLSNLVGSRQRAVSYKDNSFSFTVATAIRANVRLYDLRGRMVATVFSGTLKQGVTALRYPVDRLGHTLLLLRVRMGETEETYSMTGSGGNGFAITDQSFANAQRSKAAASPAPLDWIQASKSGYAASIQSISSYSGVINFTLSAPTAPNFGTNVKIFDPTMSMSTIQSTMNGLGNAGEMSTQRSAFLFKPGKYSLSVPINYYVHALGLGMSPDSVQITGAVTSTGSLVAFWRGAENICVTPSGGTNMWSVSQAAPFRRMHVKGNQSLSNNVMTSGGYIADSKIDGQINSGSQQQFYTRNSVIGGWSGGVWNMCCHGVIGAPADNWPGGVMTTIAQVPLVREKPFVTIDAQGNYSVFVPALRTNSSGTTWYNATPAGVSIPIDEFYIADAGTDNATTINAALAQGKNLLLTPGIYNITAPILVLRPNTVVLGIGFPSIVSQNGNGGIKVADVNGVTIAGLMFDASGTTELPVQLQIGDAKTSISHAANPTFLYDIFCRIGGYVLGKVAVNVLINSNNVVFDHCWIWRADHGNGVGWTSNVSKNGMIVNGDDVIIYGQFMEHHCQYQTTWKGERGRNYFFQCETPYDPQNWTHNGINGYAGYKVGDSVTTHEAWALGVYKFNYNGPIDNAIEVPKAPGVKMHHLVTFGGISHVINGTGSGKVAEYP